MAKTDPIRPTDDEARSLARGLLQDAAFAALGVIDPETQGPMVTRIALALAQDGTPVTLISDLSQHTQSLLAKPACSLLVGEPGPKGDPLTHPRLTLQADALFIDRESSDHAALREHWIVLRPKAKLYVDFTDFRFVYFRPRSALLNGGFGRAFRLTSEDLGVRGNP